MKRRVVALCGLVLCVGGALLAARSAGGERSQVERGRYLVTLAGCAECHTPWTVGPHGPQPDSTRMFMGHPKDAELPPPPALGDGPWNTVTGGMTAWAGPWGITFGTNLTSDVETGLGAWTEEMFIGAMRNRRHLGMGRDVLPPMPHYSEVTDEDLKAMLAYFRTVPAVANEVPDPVPPAPHRGRDAH